MNSNVPVTDVPIRSAFAGMDMPSVTNRPAKTARDNLLFNINLIIVYDSFYYHLSYHTKTLPFHMQFAVHPVHVRMLELGQTSFGKVKNASDIGRSNRHNAHFRNRHNLKLLLRSSPSNLPLEQTRARWLSTPRQ